MVFSHARVLMVREERLSAAARDAVQPGLLRAAPAARPSGSTSRSAPSPARCSSRSSALADSWLTVVGYRSQLLALVLFEAFVAARIALRLWLLASQVELQRSLAKP